MQHTISRDYGWLSKQPAISVKFLIYKPINYLSRNEETGESMSEQLVEI
jgi:hypothetical protein